MSQSFSICFGIFSYFCRELTLKTTIMAQIYKIKCPKCGTIFTIEKGVLMSWDFTKPIPEEMKEETPFNCPNCQHRMCVLDDDFNEHVESVLFAD